MSDSIPNPIVPPATPPSGDPSLGPSDLRLEIKFLLLGKEQMLSQEEARLRLSNALIPAAQPMVAAAVQKSADLMKQSVIIQTSQAILQHCSRSNPQTGLSDSPLASANLPGGDPSLGPDDARLEIQLLIVGQQEVLGQESAAVKLSHALTPPARGAVAAAIETSTDLMVHNALAQIGQAIEKRFPKSQPESNHDGMYQFCSGSSLMTSRPCCRHGPPKRPENWARRAISI